MKILLSADTHGKIPEITGEIDLVLIAGDFAKGDALRKMIFGKGNPEDAKKEIIDSSKEFLSKIKKLNSPVVVSLGNAEEFCKEEIIELLKEMNINYIKNGIIKIKGIKILCIDFFVEEWWAKKYRPSREDIINRGRKNEEGLRAALSKVEEVDIILSHLPPYGVLDMSELNEYLKLEAGPIGSKILRKFIIEKKPKLVVCGHLHIPGKERLGKTLIINPGEKKIIEL